MTRPTPPRSRARRAAGWGVTAAAAALILGGCSAAPPISPTSGIDGLVIPTPNPSPADFTDEVDNPWFPLTPGSVRLYGEVADASVRTSVEPGVQIAGVDTVGLRTTTTNDAGTTSEVLDYYTQDTAGNVWWFGRAGEWAAGQAGAEAGLVMADQPRLGDGYRQALVPGFTQSRAEVAFVGERFTTATATYDDVVAIRSEDDLRAGSTYVSYYAPGVGLIRRQVQDTTTGTIELVESSDPGA